MMLIDVQKLADGNIIVVKYTAPFDPQQDIPAAQEQIAEILKHTDGIVYRIDDLSEAEMDWDSFVQGIFAATRDVPGSMVDPRIRGVLVGEYELVQLASERMKHENYGATNTPMYHNIGEAREEQRW